MSATLTGWKLGKATDGVYSNAIALGDERLDRPPPAACHRIEVWDPVHRCEISVARAPDGQRAV
jgi:hypothetical protein